VTNLIMMKEGVPIQAEILAITIAIAKI